MLAGALAFGLVPWPVAEQAEAAAADSTLTITHTPVGGTFAKGNPVYLYAQAFSSANNLLSYQWYRSATNSNSNGTPISGATGANLVDESAKNLGAGTYYYYVVATDEKAGKTAASSTAAVKIVDKGNIGSALQNGDFEYTDGGVVVNWLENNTQPVWWVNFPFWKSTETNASGPLFQIAKEYLYGHKTLLSKTNNVAELASDQDASIYQEIATVPGSVYSWSLDHASTDPISPDTMAVVIGPTLEGKWVSGGDAIYPYGKNAQSYFHAIVNQVASEVMGPGAPATGFANSKYNKQVYRTLFDPDGSGPLAKVPYYVYIATDVGEPWFDHAGVYTVPEGQGQTVFSFVGVKSKSPGFGNMLDNISFAQGSPIQASSDVDSQGNGVLSATAKDGYAYGLLEVRGSTVRQVSNFTAKKGDAVLSEDSAVATVGGQGWYVPGAGSITFSNLTPSKTYRVVQVPVGAIGGVIGQNKTPANVLDENCYDDFAVKPVSSGAVDTVANIQVTAVTEGNASTIIVDPARSDVEYAAVAADASGPTKPITVVKDWSSSDAGRVSIPGLSPNVYYVVVGRPKGYDEITPEVAAASGTLLKTPPMDFKDIVPADIVRTADDAGVITVKNSASQKQSYLVYEEDTKKAVGKWVDLDPGSSHIFNVDASSTYQVITCSSGAVPGLGVRSYPAPSENLAIDYVGETIPDASSMPASLQYRAHDKGADTWRFGGSDASDAPWLTGTGGARVSLASALDDMAAAGAAGLDFTYRMTPAWTPAVGVEKILEVPARPAVPAAGSDYKLDYTSADEAIVAGSQAVQVRQSGATSWTLVSANGSCTLVDLGWVEKEPLDLEVRRAPVAGTSFASMKVDATVPARADGPDSAKGKKVKEADGSLTCMLTGVTDAMEYRPWGSTGPWTSVPAGATTVEGLQDGTYEVRTKATSDVPASFAVTASSTDAALVIDAALSRFDDQPWGYVAADAAKSLQVKNSGTQDARIVDIAFEGADKGAFELFGSASGSVNAGATDDTRQIAPVQGLAPGDYRANAVVSYQEVDRATGNPVGATYSAAVQLVLRVEKAAQDAPVDLSAEATAARLNVSANLPTGYALAGPAIEFSIDGGLNWVAGTPADGSFTAFFDGLAAATPYEVRARMCADANRIESLAVASTFYTTYAAPDPSALALDYVAEKVAFASGLEAASDADGTGDALASGGDISSYLGATATVFSLCRVPIDASDPVPASAWTNVDVPARPAAPTAVSSTDADSSKASNGSITVAGATALQYRKAGESAWISVNAESITGLGAGAYEVRVAATSVSFASMPATITVGAAAERFVTYLRNDGSQGDANTFDIQTLDVSSGWKATAPASPPSRDHYTFEGWHEATGFADDGTPLLKSDAFDFSQLIAADTTLYAQWKAHSYTVSFDAAGGAFASGEKPADQPVAYDGSASAPGHDPARLGYTFGKDASSSGWYLESRAADKADVFFDFSKSLAANFAAAGAIPPADGAGVVLKASWVINVYRVTFDAADADDRGGAPADTLGVSFDGWVTTDQAGVHVGPAPDPARAGYSFADWHLVDSNGGMAAVAYDFSKPLGDNLASAGIDAPGSGEALVLRAVWKDLSYTVSFTTYDGDASAPKPQTVDFTEKLADAVASSVQSVKRPGYVLDTSGGSSGWHIAGRAQGNAASFDFAKSLKENLASAGVKPPASKNVELVADWSVNAYNVVFDEDESGDLSAGETQVDGVAWTASTSGAPVDPARAGYTFAGWHIAGRVTDATFTMSDTLEANYKKAGVAAPAAGASVVLQPTFVANSYTLLFDADDNGSFDADASDTQVKGVAYHTGKIAEQDVTKPCRQGYSFVGWVFEGSSVDAGTFDFSKTLEENASALSFSAPSAPSIGEAAIRLVPVFEAQAFRVVFDVEGDGAVAGDPVAESVVYNASPASGSDPVASARPADPVRPGYAFDHWALEGAPDTRAYDFAMSLEGNCAAVPDSSFGEVELPDSALAAMQVVLRPVFVDNRYAVAFDVMGGAVAPAPENDVSFTGKLKAPLEEPSRPGYAFDSWYVRVDAGSLASVSYDFAKTLAENLEAAGFDVDGTDPAKLPVPAAYDTITLVAKWDAHGYRVLFDKNANGVADADEKAVDSAFDGTTLRPLDPVPTRPGYTLSAWRLGLRAMGSTALYDFAKSLEENLAAAGYDMAFANPNAPQVPGALSTIALVPQWNENAYKLVFDAAGGTPASTVQVGVPFASAVPADVTAPTKGRAFEFAGWHIVIGQDADGEDIVAQASFDLAKTIEENLSAAGYDTAGTGAGAPVPMDGSEVRVKASWKAVAVSAVVPLSVGVAVDYDEAGNRSVLVPAPGSYALLSTTQAPLRVAALACSPDNVGLSKVFFGGTEGVALKVNGVPVFEEGAGKTLAGVDLPSQKFSVAASPDGIVAQKIPLDLAFAVPDGLPMGYLKGSLSEADAFVKLTYTIEIDEGNTP